MRRLFLFAALQKAAHLSSFRYGALMPKRALKTHDKEGKPILLQTNEKEGMPIE